MKTWKPNWEESKENYIKWWNHEGIVLSMWEHLPKEGAPWEEVPQPIIPNNLNERWLNPKFRAKELHHYLSKSSFIADIPPVANTQLGPGSLAAIIGAELEGGEETIWIRHKEGATPNFNLEKNKAWQLHLDLLKEVKKNSTDRYFVGCPDLMEGLDVLASFKGTTEVMMDMMLQPDLLMKQLQDINDLYFKVFDEIYNIINVDGEMAFCYFSIWGPGKVSKLQSDISTMISEEDFRKWEIPFLKKQCEKIDYTLYHLDGVGAIRHLDALLEIEELNAIQWTPGYGEPQGGNPQWYDLYKRIIAGGKSIMPCWVTLDELQPLLDNVGHQGLNILMDFKSEADIEQALKIVEKYR